MFHSRLLGSALLASLVLLAGCGSTQSPAADPDPAGAKGAAKTESVAADLDALAEAARSGAVNETIHGVTVSDPYRLLETESEITARWVGAQSKRASERLERWADDGARKRLEALLKIGNISSAVQAGKRTFFLRRDGDREQPALFVAEGGKTGEAPLLDPTTYGERAALDWFVPSPSGRYVAFGLSENGDERSTLRVLDASNGLLLAEKIGQTKWVNLAWLHDESGFYFTRYPRAGEPNFDEKNPETYFQRLFFHKLGDAESNDKLVFGSETGTDVPAPVLSGDDRYLAVVNYRGWSANDVLLFDRGAKKPARAAGPATPDGFIPVMKGKEALATPAFDGSALLLSTNLDAPKYRVVKVPLARATEAAAWKTLIAEGDAPIESWGFGAGKHVVHYVENVASKVRLFDRSGKPAGEIPLPPFTSAGSLSVDETAPTVALTVAGYTHPPALFTYDTKKKALAELDRVKTDLDFASLTVERVLVKSKDGTEIPVTLARRTDLPKDGDRPVMLTGYGGFNVSLLPSFSRAQLYWLERGGIYAVANLRGGAEFGEAWHRAGNLENKANVFDDFEAAIRWFASSGWSRPARIGIIGGSNGGLLMGAMITRCPDAFGAAVGAVGLYDMVRFDKFPPAELWVSEYGSPADPKHFAWLHGYSPYHRVVDGTPYPAILIETADHDSRVSWAHSTKFAARLMEATSSKRPVLFFMEKLTGHGAGKRLSDQVETQVRRYAFLEGALGMR
jgi:prolyl oligopeptidase